MGPLSYPNIHHQASPLPGFSSTSSKLCSLQFHSFRILYLTTIQGFMSAPILLVTTCRLTFSLSPLGPASSLKPLFIQVSMPRVDCGFDTTFFGKCYPGKRDSLLVPEKLQDILFQKRTGSFGLVEPGLVVSDETSFRADEARSSWPPPSRRHDFLTLLYR